MVQKGQKMTKEELIKEIKRMKYHNASKRSWIDKELALGLVNQLDEPQKVKVPQVVADYIEYAKENDWDLQDAMDSYLIANEEDGELSEWFYKDENMEIFALAWINGYEVEGEKCYLVKMKGLRENASYLNYDSIDDEWYFADAINGPAVGTHHTRKDLENAGFGSVFNCPGIEVKEVEE